MMLAGADGLRTVQVLPSSLLVMRLPLELSQYAVPLKNCSGPTPPRSETFSQVLPESSLRSMALLCVPPPSQMTNTVGPKTPAPVRYRCVPRGRCVHAFPELAL